MSPPLSGLRVLVTRPAHQADALGDRLAAAGAEVSRLPLFAIDAGGDDAGLARRLREAHDAAGWIFTSTNAVRLAAERDPGPWPTAYAIGPATAAALRALGRGAVEEPASGSSSEALLEHPALQAVSGQRWLIVTGENGREQLADTLGERGAHVDTIALYRRRPLDYDAEKVIAEVELADVCVISSGEGLARLWAITPAASQASLLLQQLVVPSERVREQALALGFKAPLVPATPTDEDVLACLLGWRATTAPPPPPAPAAPAPAPIALPVVRARPSRAALTLAWLAVLVLAAALGYLGWLFWDLRENQLSLARAHDHALRELSRQTADLDNLSQQLSTRQADLSRVLQRQSSEFANLEGRLENGEQLMGRISDELQGGRTRFALASVEQLLLLANDRLLLERDVRAALLALQIADERLGAINDPRLFRVREAIAAERAQLQALPRPDLTSAALTLASLIDRAESLPLRARVAPRHFGAPARGTGDTASAGQAWYERVGSALGDAAAALFVIRRDDHAATLRLLPAEDEAVLVHVFVLKLEAARVALLRGETPAFRDATRSAAEWLRHYFRAEDPGVIAAQAELERLQPLELAGTPPDITGSLTRLRALLDQTAPGRAAQD